MLVIVIAVGPRRNTPTTMTSTTRTTTTTGGKKGTGDDDRFLFLVFSGALLVLTAPTATIYRGTTAILHLTWVV